MDALLADLANRRSVLALLPAGIDPHMPSQALRDEMWRREFNVQDASLPTIETGATSTSLIGQAMSLMTASSGVRGAVRHEAGGQQLPDVIHLHGFEELKEDARRYWIDFLARWAQACQGASNRGIEPSALCLVVPATTVLPMVPQSNVYLSTRWWWKFPSALEIQLLCRQSTENDEEEETIRWREHLARSLAGNDISLVDYMWNSFDLDCSELSTRLRRFGEGRGWTAKSLREWGASELTNDSMPGSKARRGDERMLVPSLPLQALWANGVLSWTAEYGLELHSAALALLDRTDDLKHRLWRGQAILLLPMIDEARLALCGYLTQRYGDGWPVFWNQPASAQEDAAVRASPLACQWGYMKELLRSCPDLHREQRLCPLVDRIASARNELAHFRPIAKSDFDSVWQAIQHFTGGH